MSHDNFVNIDERARIPLFALIAASPVIIGVCMWVGSLSSRVEADEARQERIVAAFKEDRIAFKAYAESQNLLIRDMRDRLIRIETKLDRK